MFPHRIGNFPRTLPHDPEKSPPPRSCVGQAAGIPVGRSIHAPPLKISKNWIYLRSASEQLFIE
jgi:hypothetical protein